MLHRPFGASLCAPFSSRSSLTVAQRLASAPAMSGGEAAPAAAPAPAASAAASTSGRVHGGKLRLLCLHGYLQSAAVFRTRIGSMRKALKSRVEFVFLDAPFEVAPEEAGQIAAEVGGARGGRSWFQWTQHEGPVSRPSRAVQYTNWEETYAALRDALAELKPDGLLGFSQGGAAAAVFLADLATAQQRGADMHAPLPRFAIVCAGFMPNDPKYADLVHSAQPAVPTLFIHGAADTLVPPERSRALAAAFHPAAATVYEHPGAHMVPTATGEFKQQLIEFLDSVRPAPLGGTAAASGNSSSSDIAGMAPSAGGTGPASGQASGCEAAAAAAAEQLEALSVNAC